MVYDTYMYKKPITYIYYCHSRNKVCSLPLCRLSSFHSLDEQFNTRLCIKARYVKWNFYFNKIFDANQHCFYAIHYTDTKIEIKGDTLMHDMYLSYAGVRLFLLFFISFFAFLLLVFFFFVHSFRTFTVALKNWLYSMFFALRLFCRN